MIGDVAVSLLLLLLDFLVFADRVGASSMGCLYQPPRRNTYVEILVCLDSLGVPLTRFLPMTIGDGTGLDQKVTEFEGIPRNSGGICSLVLTFSHFFIHPSANQPRSHLLSSC